jgi:glycosyltransferase involved in cell wall biosynthesis
MNPAPDMPGTSAPCVAILLCTKDGERFLAPQLDSIKRQTHSHWRIIASDDGSSDATVSLLEAFSGQVDGRIEIRGGPRRGFCQNFLSLATDPSIEADYFAYCDQDDIWDEDKLSRAVTWLETLPRDMPALYCGRVAVASADGQVTGFSPLFTRPPTFRNALVQSIAGGNTMVFNSAAHDLLVQAGAVDVVCHDWWTYLLVTACGGIVRYDPTPMLKYRQHGGNEIGSLPTWTGRMFRLPLLLAGRLRIWNDAHLQALQCIEGNLEPENRLVLKRFRNARDSGPLERLVNLRASGVYRQTVAGNLSLIAGVTLRKV